jgi:UDP:flavonoid glycosyltransferase YjiC (YdhE family)
MDKKKTMFVVPAPIRSHVLPSFYVSAKLRKAYDIYYLSSDERLKELIENQGYGFIQLQSRGIGFYAEHHHVEKNNKKAYSWIKSIMAAAIYIANTIYRIRRKEIKQLINSYNPALVLIDSFNCTDLVFLPLSSLVTNSLLYSNAHL